MSFRSDHCEPNRYQMKFSWFKYKFLYVLLPEQHERKMHDVWKSFCSFSEVVFIVTWDLSRSFIVHCWTEQMDGRVFRYLNYHTIRRSCALWREKKDERTRIIFQNVKCAKLHVSRGCTRANAFNHTPELFQAENKDPNRKNVFYFSLAVSAKWMLADAFTAHVQFHFIQFHSIWSRSVIDASPNTHTHTLITFVIFSVSESLFIICFFIFLFLPFINDIVVMYTARKHSLRVGKPNERRVGWVHCKFSEHGHGPHVFISNTYHRVERINLRNTYFFA